jgi:hypothetical protein
LAGVDQAEVGSQDMELVGSDRQGIAAVVLDKADQDADNLEEADSMVEQGEIPKSSDQFTSKMFEYYTG